MSDASAQVAPMKGSFDSTFWRIRVPANLVPEVTARLDWNTLGRRVIV